MPAPKTATPLSAKRREALERMQAGQLMVTDESGFRTVDGWQVASANFYWLVQHRLIRVLDPSRKSDARGNGHVISAKGIELLQNEAI